MRQQSEVAIGVAGQVDLGRGFAQHVADPANFHMVAELAAGGERGGRPGEVADVQAIKALGIAGVSRLADGDHVGAVLGGDQRNEAILPDQGVVVARGQFEPLRVQDRHVRVEQRQAKANSLHLDRDPLPFLRADLVIVDVFIARDAVDRHVHVDLLRPGEIVIGLDLGHLLERPDAEGLQGAHARGGANAEIVQAERRRFPRS